MKITKYCFPAVLCFSMFDLFASEVLSKPQPAEKIDLRILYVGRGGAERARDFADFLSQHFKEVKTGDPNKFNVKQAKNADVLILDSPRSRVDLVEQLKEHAGATVTIGADGARLCRALKLKTGYL